ncbi:MAG: hypothetical protein QM662_19465, partial [Gordonia sp. (in: high G+C Gram-positive bacteria)]
ITGMEFGFGMLWESAPPGDHVLIFRDVEGPPPAGWCDDDVSAVRAFRAEVAAAADALPGTAVGHYTVTSDGRDVDLEHAVTPDGFGRLGAERLFRDDRDLTVGRDDVIADAADRIGALTVIIDALDVMTPTGHGQELWPVRVLPPNVRFVVSTTVDEHAGSLDGVGAQPMLIRPLPGAVAASCAATVVSRTGRALPAAVLDHIERRGRSPLWIRLATDLLADLDADDFAAIATEPDQAAAIARLLTDEVRRFPDAVDELAGFVLDRVGARIGSDAGDVIVGLLAGATPGLAPADLANCLPGVADAPHLVAVARRVLGDQVRAVDAAGRLAFVHAVVRDAAARRAPSDQHARIVGTLAARPWDDTDARTVLTHGLRARDSDAATVADAVARALDHAPPEASTELLRTIAEHPAAVRILRAIPPAALTDRSVGTILTADGTARDHLSPQARLEVARIALDMAQALGDHRTVMWAFGVLGNSAHALGDYATAAAAWGRELGIANELLRLAPGSAMLLGDVIVSLGNVGRLHMDSGRLAPAEEAFAEAIRLARHAVDQWPESAGAIKDLATALGHLGQVQQTRGAITDALRSFDEALPYAEQLRELRPADPYTVLYLSQLWSYVGLAHETRGTSVSAAAAYDNAFHIARRVRSDHPTMAVPLERLGDTLFDRGRLRTATGDRTGGARDLDEALAAARTRSRLEPGVVEAERKVLRILLDIAHVLCDCGDPRGADEYVREAQGLVESLLSAHPDLLFLHRDRVLVHTAISRVALETGDLGRAQRAIGQAHEFARHVMSGPDDPRSMTLMGVVLAEAGTVAGAAGDPQAAHDAYESAVRLYEGLVTAAPENADHVTGLSAVLRELGEKTGILEGPAAAIPLLVRALDAARKLAELRPNAVRPLVELDVTLGRLGQYHFTLRAVDEAERAFTEQLSVAERAVALADASFDSLGMLSRATE